MKRRRIRGSPSFAWPTPCLYGRGRSVPSARAEPAPALDRRSEHVLDYPREHVRSAPRGKNGRTPPRTFWSPLPSRTCSIERAGIAPALNHRRHRPGSRDLHRQPALCRSASGRGRCRPDRDFTLVHYYAVEARNYSLVELETLAILYVAYRAIQTPDELKWWVLLAFAQTTQLWTHNYAVFLLPAPALVCFLVGGRERIVRSAKAAAASSLAVVLSLPCLLRRRQERERGGRRLAGVVLAEHAAGCRRVPFSGGLRIMAVILRTSVISARLQLFA